MNFDEYQQAAGATAVYPGSGTGEVPAMAYCVIGLNGEAGEVAEKVKKLIRDGGGIRTNEWEMSIIKEMGDVLWYLSQLAAEVGVSLDFVADQNIAKLRERARRNMVHGDGDDR